MIRTSLRNRLLAGAALALALALPAPLLAQEETETSRYTMQALTQNFDGEREYSQSQAIAYARMRQGEESWIELDFGNGAVVIENAGGISAGRFVNVSGVDAGLHYNYATRELADGGSRVQRFHNTFVRRHLGAGPALGSDARWNIALSPADLGVTARSDAPITIELSREYIRFEGRDYVLLHYRVPAFAYTADGRQVVQWGEGAALTDPGFGTMYWNSALHRAVGEEAGTSGRPYRHMKTLAALGEDGRAMIDPRAIPQVAAIAARLDGAGARDVLGFVEGPIPDRTPLLMAYALDVMALSLAEDSPNQLGEITSQLINGANGLNYPSGSNAPGQGATALPLNSVSNSLSAIASQIAIAIQQAQNAGQGQAQTTQSLRTMLSQVGAMAGQIGAAMSPGDAVADPATLAMVDALAGSIGSLSGQLDQTLQQSPPAAPALNGLSGLLTQASTQLTAALAASQLATANRAAQLASFDATLAALDRRGDELAVHEAGIEAAYAQASAARAAALANQSDQNLAQLASSADALFNEARQGWRLAEAHRRQAVIAYNEIRANGTSEQIIAALARISDAERFVAEAQRFTTYAEGVGFVLNELESGEVLELEDPAIGGNTVEVGGGGGGGGGGAASGGNGASSSGGGASSGGGGTSGGNSAQPHAGQAATLAAELASAEAARQRREADMRGGGAGGGAQTPVNGASSATSQGGLSISGLNVSGFPINPVVFVPPEWVPPEWVPPEWVPPQFDPPGITPIDWTDFADDDYPGTDANLAYNYGNLSGTVETDLSRWADWLATQDVRRLERLARQAGYPNLASALADGENIIRQSQDDGYRRWAMQAPSCGGYVGCGPSYLERWHMKTSIVALGDILVDSREIFSSGGFSDIGITGSQLSYLLRDHGTQDGDIVQISIRQFGRTIYEGRLSLTNVGNDFNLSLRPGVASLSIYAENEGTFSPNTAQIRVDNVVVGDATQTYNLNTNQTATLRIATNATPAGGN